MNNKPVVLLVEDDAEAADDYKEEIEELVDVAVITICPPPTDLLDLVALVEEHRADAVILDQVLPQRSDATYLGIDALQQLREAFPGLPTIIFTAYPDNPELKERGLPFDDFVKKREFDRDQDVRATFAQELYRRMRRYRQTQDDLHAPLESATAITQDLVERLARMHFATEATIERIIWFTGEEELGIRLIEVNRTAFPTGTVDVFRFAPSPNVPFPILIADVTPKEWREIQEGTIPLPDGWDLTSVRVFSRDEQSLGEEDDGVG